MKRIFLILVSFFIVCGVYASDDSGNNDKHTIIIKKKKYEDPTSDVTPLSFRNDIEANYYYGVVTFVVNKDLGDSDIVVTNTTTGESWYDSVNGAGATSIALSGNEGYYEIYIYTDCGDYSGTFII